MMEGAEIFDPEVLDEMLGELDSHLSRERSDAVRAGAVTQGLLAGPPHGAPHDAWQATAVLARDVSKAAITPEKVPRLAILQAGAQSKAREAAQGAEALRRATLGMQRIRHAVASQAAASMLLAQSKAPPQYVQPQHLAHYPPLLGTGSSSSSAVGGQKRPLPEAAPASPFSSPNLRFLANFLDAPGLQPSLQPTGAFSGLPSSPYQGPLYPQTAASVVIASPLPCLQPKPSAGGPSAGGRCIEKELERQPSLSSAVSSAPSSPIRISSSAAATDAACPTIPAPAAILPPALPVSSSASTSTFAAITTTTHSATMASPAAEVAQPAGADAQCSLHEQRLEAQRKAKVQARVALAIAQARQKAGDSLKRSRGEEEGGQAAPRPSSCLVRAWSAALNSSHSPGSFELDNPSGVRPVRAKLLAKVVY